MKFFAILALPLLAYAQRTSDENPFKIPTTGLAATAGSTVTLNWEPTTQGTVSIFLRSGASNALNQGTAIAENIPNSGTYQWNLPSSLVRGSDYALEIRSAGGDSNYTPPFVIESTNTVASTTSGSASSSGTATRTSSGSSSSATGSSSSMSGTMTTTGSSSSGSSSASSTGTSSRSSTSGANFQSTSSASAQSTGGAPRVTAAAGMMGLIALGAMAL